MACPGDSGGPSVIGADGPIFQITSTSGVETLGFGGEDGFADPVKYRAELVDQILQWTKTSCRGVDPYGHGGCVDSRAVECDLDVGLVLVEDCVEEFAMCVTDAANGAPSCVAP